MDVTGNVALRLDDEVTFLQSASGGEIFADVVDETGSVGPNVKKHLAAVKYEDISLGLGLAMSDALFDWIAASWRAQDARKDGAIVLFDHALAIHLERQFVSARVAATTIPTLDAASKGLAQVSLVLAPEAVSPTAGSGKLQVSLMRQKLWRAPDFRLDIEGLDCTKVGRIGAFTVPGALGGRVDFPALDVTLAASAAATWTEWFQDFVIAGNNGDVHERTGKITFLLPDLETPLATIALEGLGIFRLETDAAGAPSQVARVTAGLYCERMSLQRGGGTPA